MATTSLTEGLGPGGARLVREILADLDAAGLEPDAKEQHLLRAAGEARDRLDSLAAIVAEDGERLVSSTGVIKVHPAVSEMRQLYAVLPKLLGSISLAENGGKSARHQAAAARRWDLEAKRKAS